MDSFDNPDHGGKMFDGVKVVDRPFNPAEAKASPTPAPYGGPNFPALEDAEINPVPT